MALQNKDLPRFSIVIDRPYLKQILMAMLGLWLILLAAFIWLVWQGSDSNAYKLGVALSNSQRSERRAEKDLASIKQELANIKRSEFITRTANNQIQRVLAEKDEQIAGLKADLDFYQRLVGASGRRHGLIVHNAEFAPDSDGAWQYTVTLTQNINRGGITSGQMRFDVDGVIGGKLKSIGWNVLLQNPKASGQAFSFRYFQELQGNIMLPKNFTPQHARVTLSGTFGKIEKSLNWTPNKVTTINTSTQISGDNK